MPTDSPSPLFSASQRRVLGASATFGALLGSLTLLIAAAVVVGRLVVFFANVIWPLAVAGVIALILRPAIDRLEKTLQLSRLSAVILLLGGFLLSAALLLFLIAPSLVAQLLDFIAYLPKLWANTTSALEKNYPAWIALGQKHLDHPAVRTLAESFASETKTLLTHTGPSLRTAFGGIFNGFAFVAHLAIVPVYTFFFLLIPAGRTLALEPALPFLRPNVRADVVFLVNQFVAIVESFFRGQILIGLIVGCLLALGFTAIGLTFGLFLGLAVGLLNIVPYLGTILGLTLALLLAFFQPGGGWPTVGLVLAVSGFVQCIESWVLTPRILGKSTGLHPLMIIVAVFFWGTAFDGILGMLLAIPLTAFVVTVWRLLKHKYLPAPHV